MRDRLARWAATRPDHLAFALGDDRMTYGQLLSAATGLARGIREHRTDAVRFGQRWPEPLVAISLPNSASFACAFAAADIAGAVVAVLDPAWPLAQTQAAIGLLRPDSLITEDPDVARHGPAGSERTAWLVPGGAARAATPDWAPPDPASRFLIGFTSGTTSRPKAFVRTHRSWLESLRHSEAVFAAHEWSVTLAPGPLAHGLSLYALAESLFSGGTFVSLPRFGEAEVAAAAERLAATRFVGVPTMYQRLLETPATAGALGAVSTFISSGSKMPPAVLSRLFAAAPGSTFLEYYGASELSFVSVGRATAATAGGAPAADVTDVGGAFPGVEIQVRGPSGDVLPDRRPGLVYVRSPLVSDGYLTEERSGFRRDGQWCTVGDYGHLDAGRLHILGREGDMVIVGGNNIYPSEVEAALRSFGAIEDAYVVAVDDPLRGAKLVAIVSAADADRLDIARLRAHLAARLPRYKLPRALAAVSRWPMTNSGKVSKEALRVAYLAAGPDIQVLPWN
ncbi:class I adenylate-forming enzyme family protein [Actinoplanes siamensis]|uniref:class I adenylate-forming enzyme family protein n=1 Tax=Actinoplanes siamensis TaxID=1223317 RepID=UPI001940EA71|nr:class I adenylate-forming enzyme family protein [Actinoplanes siamensis]